MSKQEKIQQIIKSIQHRGPAGKTIADRRRDALLEAGFEVSQVDTIWNFGKTGTIKEQQDGSLIVQVAYATGGKTQNGFGVNACPCVTIK